MKTTTRRIMKNKHNSNSNSSTQIEEEEEKDREKQLYTKNKDKRELCFHILIFLFFSHTKQECHSTTI